MDDLLKLLGKLSDFWDWLVGLVAGSLAAFTAWRKCGHRIRRSVLLSDRIHDHFGSEAGQKMVAEFQRRSKDIQLGEVRLQFLEARNGIALYVCSRDGSCVYASETLAELFGLERAEMLQNGWMQAIDKSERKKVMEFWEYAIQHRMPYDYEYTAVNQKSGERFQAATKSFPTVSSSGEILFYVGIVERVSEGGKNP